ncbi:MAG: 1-phosphofructokinase family hexose kinase [Planctomyces sp.]|nr:1-phosphofructokinase family hexose kinase [Planctomyces sp.]
MILAAGLSPAWQYVLVFDRLEVGHVNRARGSEWFASGKALNVGLALNSLDAPSRTLSIAGGATGDQLRRDFTSSGAAARWIRTEAGTRICTTLINQASGETTELVENSPAIRPGELDDFRAAFAEEARTADVIVCSGSLPEGAPRNYYAQLFEAAASDCPALSSSPARVVLDIRGPELLACLPNRPFLVKPNREELAATLQRPLDDDRSLLDGMRELNRAGAEWVLVTQGGEPAWLASERDLHRIRPPRGLRVVNPIGCGDCVAAGVACGLSRNLDPVECVRLGMAAAAANLEQMSSARFDALRVRELAAQVVVEPV